MNSIENHFFITAIGTDSGKTLSSAILVHHLKATYWKPIQCGTPTDTSWISTVLGPEAKVLKERFFLQTPASPHFAAKEEGLEIKLEDFVLPKIEGPLIVEGAGGLMVPLNGKDVLADLVSHLNLPVVLVINHYLGALNHSLLTISELNKRKIKIAGLIFNGHDFQDAEKIILARCEANCWLRIPKMNQIGISEIEELSQKVKINAL